MGDLLEGGLRRNRMPHEGFTDPVTSDETGFHSNMPISELTERINRAIEASDVSATPPVAETTDGATITKTSDHRPDPCYARGLEESCTRKETERAVAERWLRS